MIAEKASGGYTDIRIPGIVATRRGTLLCYCECRRSASDWAHIDIKLSRSEDEGKSWETVLCIAGDGNTLNNPVMTVDGEKLIFLWCKNYKEIWQQVSTDDGRSFSQPQRVAFEESADFAYHVVAVGPGHGIVHNERLIVPVWFACNDEKPKSHHPSFISTLYSDDHGESWRLGEIIFRDALVDPSECALAVTAENEVLISIRHEGETKCRGLARSRDGISAWRELRFAPTLPDPVCMGSMTHREGTVLHINCDSTSARKNLTVKISRDGFAHFQSIVVSEMAGYADLALVGNTLFVFHEKKNAEGAFELHFERIELPEELFAYVS